MKLTAKQLKKIIIQELNETKNLGSTSFNEFGADEPTERMPKMQMMNKEKFIKHQILDWVHEFEAVDQGEADIIAEILKDAYDEIGHALEMDNTGLYESRGFGNNSYTKRPRTSRDLISYARNLLLYNPNESGGMSAHPIRKEQDGEYMRFFINKDGLDIEIFVNHSGSKVYRMGKLVDTGEQVDLIPDDTSGNMQYGGRGQISLK